MLKYFLFLINFFLAFAILGSPRVPSTYYFADIKLNISDGARRQIQADVDALHKSQVYLKKKVVKIDLYFDIIERVFMEENLPDDFKFLVIQESALISDAVSTSNAVGFWQFKEASGKEVGLRIDRNIDERMHITASSHAAAKYLKKNNFFFNNWIYALLAYNTGPTGANKHVNKKYFGKKKMDITKQTHWYVKKFLAYKIAFENEIHKNTNPTLQLYEYEDTKGKSLKDISDYFEIDHKKLTLYNKWLRKGKIPSDKTYLGLIPVSTQDFVAQSLLVPEVKYAIKESPKSIVALPSSYESISGFNFEINQQYPKVNKSIISKRIKINGIPGFIASSNDNLNSVLIRHSISESKFLKYNDLTKSDQIIGGQVYYLKLKKAKAKINYHVVITGETAWSISQKYGLKIKKLMTKNRMLEEKDLSSGMVLWLRHNRPSDVPISYKKNDAQNVIVKSYSNEIEYTKNSYTSQSPNNATNNKNTNDTKIEDQLESEYLFDEVDEESEYLSEYSSEVSNDNLGKTKTPKNEKKKYKLNVNKAGFYHIVKSSETLFSISRKYNVSIGELRQWNDIDDLDVLNVGQKIFIGDRQETKIDSHKTFNGTKYKTYTVKHDDTLYGIARTNGLSIKELMDINDKEDFIISEGEIIKIRALK